MTVQTTLDRQFFDGDGVNKNFPFNFKYFNATQIKVYLIGPSPDNVTTELVLNTNYTLVGSGFENNNGGTVTTVDAPPLGWVILIRRILPAVQLTSVRNQARFFPAMHENVFDYLTYLIQQALYAVTNSLQLDEGARSWDAKGKRIINVGDPVNPKDAVTKSWILAFIETVSGAINTTVGILYDAGTLYDYLKNGLVREVDTIALLKTMSKTRNTKVHVRGYYAAGDGGGGDYWFDASDVATADNGGTVIVAADGGRWKLRLEDRISIKQFGAKGDGVNDSVAIDRFIAFWMAGRIDGYIPTGNYVHTGRILMDCNLNAGRVCPRMYGDGPYSSTITSNWNGGTSAINLFKTTSGGDVTAFQGKFERIGFNGNTPFVFFQIAKDDLLDNLGNFTFDQCFFSNQNTTSGASAVTLKLNWLFDCEFRNCVVVGKPMYGTAVWSRKQHFCKHTGGSYSNANNAILFNGGPNFNNTYDCVDFENVKFACYGDDASAEHIYFINCYYDIYDPIALAYPAGAYPIYVGSSQVGGFIFDGCKWARPQSFLYAYSTFGVPGAISPSTAMASIVIKGKYPGQATPAMPASGGVVTNNTGQVQLVNVSAATTVAINGSPYPATGGVCFILNPGDTITPVYTTTPYWLWRAVK